MSVRVLEHAQLLDSASHCCGEVLVYPQTHSDARLPELRWTVAVVKEPGRRQILGRLASRADALCYALAYCAGGWPNDTVVREAAYALIRDRHSPLLEQRINDLAAALGAMAPPPRVLVVVDHGVARAYATPGVLVGMANLDSQRLFSPQELAPMHSDFSELLQQAGVQWPLSPHGRRQAAAVVSTVASSEAPRTASHAC